MPSTEIYSKINPKKSNHKKYWLIGICILVFICIIAGYFYKTKEEQIHYITANAHMGDVIAKINATGTLSPTDEVQIGSQISGTVQEVFVDVNDPVSKGQVLARINPEKINQALDKYKAQINSAKASLFSSEVLLEQKKWNYEQMQKLFKATEGKSPSELDLQNAKMEYLQAKADVQTKKASIEQITTDMRTSEIDLKNSVITSPIDGVVLERSVDPGQTVAASFQTPTLFKLAQNLREMSLIVNVSESDIGKVKPGQKVVFNVDAYPDKEFDAEVNRVSFAAASNDDNTNNIVSYETKIYVNNQDLLLKPGMSVNANIQVAQAYNVLLVPVAALFYEPKTTSKQNQKNSPSLMGKPRKKAGINEAKELKSKTSTIYILKNNVPTPINVDVGISDGKSVQIISDDIDTNTQIITSSTKK
ncbi:efflux RND transporter periplasmic adaptor subunit [Helicobacter cappadocius]|uniref:Efflux RND transporter periplasmic adaptor subunit n=1 Tax=Helicobacter cappadocius TaxID=3063998 RepID=A0AA90PT85_9HELI|nr:MULTISPECIES: efflux RND transporter periplasmic adaptor subunit [unclassified Helicobacter]MDO7252926.1 efflux RND transporter periplasmic adaptor subunit [Helicobacter sp. faydin-H75]MDP2539084.1 efflux RND transporter periplasmic adaptor subunit [Helicobacter sp. faydin-H76]